MPVKELASDDSVAELVALSDQCCTAEQAARIWTRRAERLGFYHTYDAGSIRKAQQQGRLQLYTHIGSVNIYMRRAIEELPIRPWMRLGTAEDAARLVPCPHCEREVTAQEVVYRTWVWCAQCRERDAAAFDAEVPQQVEAEAARTAAANRLASLRRRKQLVVEGLLLLTDKEQQQIDTAIAQAFARHDGG